MVGTLAAVSGLLGLVATALVVLLGSMLMDSHDASDRAIGVVVSVLGVAWLGLPLGGAWLALRTERVSTGVAMMVGSILISVVLAWLMTNGIGAAARP